MPDGIGHGAGPAASQTSLRVGKLIRDELKGKHVALARYDAILWKVRSGYIAVLYGVLTFIVSAGLKGKLLTPEGFFLVLGFSFFACLLDYTFVRSKMRVVDATNHLSDEALQIALGEKVNEERLRRLLHVAGESGRKVKPVDMWRAFTPPLLLYSITPIVAGILLMKYSAWH